MIVLLPLRGWVGDAMATQMAANAVHHSVEAQAAPHQADGKSAMTDGMPPDCAGHGASPAADATGHPVDQTETDLDAGIVCDSCSTCQACHSVALSVDSADGLAARLLVTAPAGAAVRFASAEAILGHKPPIS